MLTCTRPSQLPLLDSTCSVNKYGGRSDGYGAWHMCSEHMDAANVFSVGIGGDVSFDVTVVRRHRNASVFCFDPTISHSRFDHIVDLHNLSADARARVHFYPFGLGAVDDVLPMYKSKDKRIGSLVSTPGLPGYNEYPYLHAPMLKLLTLQFVAKRSPPWRIDVLKVDIEGAEFSVFNNTKMEMKQFLACSPIMQVAIEFHDRMVASKRRSEPQEKKHDRSDTMDFLRSCGFYLRHSSASHEELLFVRTEPPSSRWCMCEACLTGFGS